MKARILIMLLICLNALAIQGQTYDVDLFIERNNTQLDIWTYGAWQPTDSTNITAEISKLGSIYTFKVNSISSNQRILWSESTITKLIFPFKVSESNNVIVVNQDEFENMFYELKKDYKKNNNIDDEELDKMEGYQNLLFSPGIMYEAYHEPYIEILKYYLNKEFETKSVDNWEPNFSDSIPATLLTQCQIEGDELISKHELIQSEKNVCNYLFDKKIKNYKEQGRDTIWYAKTFSRDKCPYMHTEYRFETISNKIGNKYSPKKIIYNRIKPTAVRIEIDF